MIKAAENGNGIAQNNLGDCYRYGEIIPKNILKANKWYTNAAGNGIEFAKRMIVSESFKKDLNEGLYLLNFNSINLTQILQLLKRNGYTEDSCCWLHIKMIEINVPFPCYQKK